MEFPTPASPYTPTCIPYTTRVNNKTNLYPYILAATAYCTAPAQVALHDCACIIHGHGPSQQENIVMQAVPSVKTRHTGITMHIRHTGITMHIGAD